MTEIEELKIKAFDLLSEINEIENIKQTKVQEYNSYLGKIKKVEDGNNNKSGS